MRHPAPRPPEGVLLQPHLEHGVHQRGDLLHHGLGPKARPRDVAHDALDQVKVHAAADAHAQVHQRPARGTGERARRMRAQRSPESSARRPPTGMRHNHATARPRLRPLPALSPEPLTKLTVTTLPGPLIPVPPLALAPEPLTERVDALEDDDARGGHRRGRVPHPLADLEVVNGHLQGPHTRKAGVARRRHREGGVQRARDEATCASTPARGAEHACLPAKPLPPCPCLSAVPAAPYAPPCLLCPPPPPPPPRACVSLPALRSDRLPSRHS